MKSKEKTRLQLLRIFSTQAVTSTEQSFSNESNNVIYNLFSCPFVPYWKNHGYCDDASNIKECNFDNGDCCLAIVKSDFCAQCLCHLDETRHNQTIIGIKEGCDEEKVNDGVCNDQNNKYECGFEINDCCQELILCLPNKDGKECICHLDGTVHDKISKNESFSIFYLPYILPFCS